MTEDQYEEPGYMEIAMGVAKNCNNDPECREGVKQGAITLGRTAMELYREFNQKPEQYEVCDEYEKFFSPEKRGEQCIAWDTIKILNELARQTGIRQWRFVSFATSPSL